MASMTSRRSRSLALLGLAVVPVLALAACSTASPAGPASHAAAAKAVSHASSSAAPGHPKGMPITTGEQLCTLATAKEATEALGTTKPITDLLGQNGNDGPSCAYSGAGLSTSTPLVLVSLERPTDGGTKDGRYNGLPLTVVPGLGKQAGVNDTELDVILSDHWLQIVNNNPAVKISRDQLVAFGKLLVSRY